MRGPNFFQTTGKPFKDSLHLEAQKSIRNLSDYTIVIGILETQGRKNFTYVPSELRIPLGPTPTQVNWISWDGKVTLDFRRTPNAPKSPLAGNVTHVESSKPAGSDVYSAEGQVLFDPGAQHGTRYHFTVTLTPSGGGPDIVDDECPPIIVD